MNGFPAFVKRDTLHPTVDDLIDHADHVCQLSGSTDHVAVGIDYYPHTAGVAKDPEADREFYEATLAAGIWSSRNYPPPAPSLSERH
jgi:microsomal dipeptidase-like Zn-dependent dipeptidase